jgi:class 3 adenylate cyclase
VTSATPQTRGFLFADLRGYSRFTEEHGDHAAAELIRRFRDLVRAEITAFHGAEIRTEGDSFYVVFGSVSEAVQAGLAIRDAAARSSTDTPGAPIRVGIGIHAGEATDGDLGIVSSAVNIAARVCSVAEPGEVLVTDTVRSLTRGFLAVEFRPRGRRRLKGIREPVALFRAEPVGTVTRTRSTPSTGQRAAIVGAFIAGVVVIVTVALTTARAPGADPVGSADSTPTAEGTAPEETHDLGRFTDPGEFPNREERALLAYLPPRIADRCERADPDDTPSYRFGPEEADGRRRIPLAARAGLDCLVDGIRVLYWQATAGQPVRGAQGASDLFFNVARHLSITEGSCSESSRVRETWQAGLHSGNVLCYSGENGAVMHWTFDDLNVYAVASDRAGDADALYAWWRDVGRLLGR